MSGFEVDEFPGTNDQIKEVGHKIAAHDEDHQPRGRANFYLKVFECMYDF